MSEKKEMTEAERAESYKRLERSYRELGRLRAITKARLGLYDHDVRMLENEK